MKRNSLLYTWLVLLLGIFLPSSCYALSADTIVTVDNDIIYCENVRVGNSIVRYTKPGQSLEYTMPNEYVISINSKSMDSYASTLVTTTGDVIKCNVRRMDANSIIFSEAGKKAEMSLPKSQVASLVAPDGTVETFASTVSKSDKERPGYATGYSNSVPQNRTYVPQDTYLQLPSNLTYSNKGRGSILCNGQTIGAEKYMDMCNSLDARLWTQYRRGSGLRGGGTALITIGTICAGVGIPLLVVGSLYSYSSYTGAALYLSGCVMSGFGWPTLTAGVVLYCVGVGQRRRSVNNFNAAVRNQDGYYATLNIGATSSGLGLSLEF